MFVVPRDIIPTHGSGRTIQSRETSKPTKHRKHQIRQRGKRGNKGSPMAFPIFAAFDFGCFDIFSLGFASS